MSVSEETQAVQPPVRNKKRQRRNALMLLTLLFVNRYQLLNMKT